MEKKWVIGLALFFLLMVLELAFLHRAPVIATAKPPQHPSPVSTFAEVNTAATSNSSFNLETWLQSETELFQHPSADPENAQKRIETRAHALHKTEILELGKKSLDTGVSPDERFMSVFILGLTNQLEGLEQLKLVATSPLPEQVPERSLEFERTLRAHAIESHGQFKQRLEAAQNLLAIKDRVQDEFLLDRTQRTLTNLSRPERSPAAQDEWALKKLLSRTL